ncbi:hypothetical protein DB346_21455 [Verrucomicrobia bacterium LW23]|nr:hypothetical protein DB346_21455 [Verrucomicrobia bacterium LW23]
MPWQEIKLAMGNKTVFYRRFDERKDIDVLDVVLGMSLDFRLPFGAQVKVAIDCATTPPPAPERPASPATPVPEDAATAKP